MPGFGPQEKIPDNAKWGRSLGYCGHRDADTRLAGSAYRRDGSKLLLR